MRTGTSSDPFFPLCGSLGVEVEAGIYPMGFSIATSYQDRRFFLAEAITLEVLSAVLRDDLIL